MKVLMTLLLVANSLKIFSCDMCQQQVSSYNDAFNKGQKWALKSKFLLCIYTVDPV